MSRPPIAPPKPTSPATEATIVRSKRSVGTTITRVDQDCWPKNATLKRTMAQLTGTCVTSRIAGITAALSPSASLREKFTERPSAMSRLENHPPSTLPTPEAANGTHA